MKLEGVFVAHVTLFDDHGNLALNGMKRLLESLADAGVHGLVPCGTTGESATLTKEERRKVISLAREVATARKIKMIAGCGSNCTSAVHELISEAADLGAEAALVVTPYYNKPTPRGLLAHFEAIADKSPLPVVLYNVPGRTNCPLPVDVVQKLWKHPKIVAIKEASGTYSQWLSLASTLELDKKALLAGDDDAFAPILALGGSGIISASATVAPAAFVALYEEARKGNWEAAFAWQKKLYPLTKALFLETSPAPAKYALGKRGYDSHLRLPLVSVTESTEIAVAQALKELELT